MVRNKLHWDANNAVELSNKGNSGWTGTSLFGLEVPLRHLRPSIIYFIRNIIVSMKNLFKRSNSQKNVQYQEYFRPKARQNTNTFVDRSKSRQPNNNNNNNTLFTHATSRSDKNSLKHVRETKSTNGDNL